MDRSDALHLPHSHPANWLRRLGDGMRRHRRVILGIQWSVVGFYLVLVAAPAFLPLPPEHAHMYDNLALFAQFVFWGIWWPFVMVSMMALGRVWCGVFCPEGALTEQVSRYGLNLKVPVWLKWGGWPFVAFLSTTLFGQLVSVYQYPKPALLILGGSTAAALVVGFLYGRGKRVWCRHLCPASGVFALLAKVSLLHFRVDREDWERAPQGKRASAAHAVHCAPLIDIRRMTSASQCHACGRCAGERGAVHLGLRSPNSEILNLRAGDVNSWEGLLLIFGVLGIATGAFQWSASPYFVAVKQAIAEWLVEREILWPLASDAPWWLLTHYPEANDVFTWLDGALILAYILAVGLALGGWIFGALFAAARILGSPKDTWRLAMSLVPLGGVSVFLGLSQLTVTLLRAEGVMLPGVGAARAMLLAGAMLWSARLAWGLTRDAPLSRRIAAMVLVLGGAAAAPMLWWKALGG